MIAGSISRHAICSAGIRETSPVLYMSITTRLTSGAFRESVDPSANRTGTSIRSVRSPAGPVHLSGR